MEKNLIITDPIVVVEDDADDQYFIRTICEKLGVTSDILFFDDGKKALHYLQTTQRKTFLILCDINMPIMNGLELRKHIQEDEGLRRKSIPFVFFTTSPQREAIEVAYDMMVQGYFKKPNTIREVKELLKTMVNYWVTCLHPNV